MATKEQRAQTHRTAGQFVNALEGKLREAGAEDDHVKELKAFTVDLLACQALAAHLDSEDVGETENTLAVYDRLLAARRR